MESVAVGALRDLFPATEAIGDNKSLGRSFANGWQQFQLSNLLRKLVLLLLKAKRSSHPTASRGGRVEVEPHAGKDCLFVRHFHDGFVVAVPVDERFSAKLRHDEVLRLLFQEFAEQVSLFGQSVGAIIVRKQVAELVAEDGYAAGLKADDWDSGGDFGTQDVERFEQQPLGPVQHAKVVQRAAAAEICLRNQDFIASRIENFNSRTRGFRMKVVVKRVRPEDDLRTRRSWSR